MGMCLGKAYTLLGEKDPLEEQKMDRDVSILSIDLKKKFAAISLLNSIVCIVYSFILLIFSQIYNQSTYK